MQIEIINVEATDKGKYKQLDVNYKDNGKVASRKVFSFGKSEPAFLALTTAVNGNVFDIQMEKEGKFWNWISATKVDKPVAVTATPVPQRGNWETPEERAQRQVYIIRQSSLSSAISLLKTEKVIPKVDDIIWHAKIFENYVLGKETTGFENMSDDIPL